jgi:hypothetical protein
MNETVPLSIAEALRAAFAIGSPADCLYCSAPHARSKTGPNSGHFGTRQPDSVSIASICCDPKVNLIVARSIASPPRGISSSSTTQLRQRLGYCVYCQ